MQEDPVSIALKAYQAYADKDRGAIEAVIADDFHFTSPLDSRIDRETYFERCWPNSETITAFEFINAVSRGDRAYVTYEVRTSGSGRFRNTENLTVQGGQIVEVEVYFGWSIPHKAPTAAFLTISARVVSALFRKASKFDRVPADRTVVQWFACN